MGRVYILAKVLQRIHKVEVAGPLFGRCIWAPLAEDNELSYKFIRTGNKFVSIRSLKKLYDSLDGDIIYAVKPNFISFNIGLIKKYFTKRILVLDIDNWELGLFLDYFNKNCKKFSSKIFFYIKELFKFFFKPWNSFFWTILNEKLVKYADEITVSNKFLKDKFGGTVIYHGRDVAAIASLSFNKEALKQKYNALVLFSSNDGYCGNAKAMYEYMLKNCPEYRLLWAVHSKKEIQMLKANKIKCYYSFSIPGIIAILRAKYLLTTHLEFSRFKAFFGQKYINLWHGMLIKKLGYMDPGERQLWNYKFTWKSCDIVSVPSGFYGQILSAQTGIDYTKCKITGFARNDYLFNSDGKKNLKILFPDIAGFKKVILYCPTFRTVLKRTIKRTDSIYDIEFFINKYFKKDMDSFFKEHKICCLIKLHPFEEEIIDGKNFGKSIKIVTNEILKEKGLSLEEILNGIDLLITDYSSIYIDYLLLGRPIMFVADDVEEYKKRRGIIFDDYDFVICGPKIFTEARFKKEILILLSDPGYFREERKEKLKIFHEIKSNFCKSLLNEIKSKDEGIITKQG